ncbi:MAG: hypothetical protein JO115_15420 [Pseudonocardiales bacterium]|nr:hypothetical protein [Pseudonocardiales bacterium]
MAVLDEFIAEYGSAEDQAGLRGKAVRTTLSDELVQKIEGACLDRQLVDRTLRAYQVSGAKFALVVGRGLPEIGFVVADEAHFVKNPKAQ